MVKGKKPCKEVKKEKIGHRPTDYKPEYDEIAYKICLLLGATDEQLAKVFDCAESTIHKWKIDFPSFSESINKGKIIADAEIAKSLYHRAKGYEHGEDHIFQYEGNPVIVPTVKHYPPDTAAAFIWLKNRQKAYWKDRKEVTGENGGPIKIQNIDTSKMTDEEIKTLYFEIINGKDNKDD